ncbi:MAG: DEAD/DEAH box helicase family protein, partial [Desulfobacterales bacterium]
MIKSKLSERDICTKYITPAISDAGWNENPHHFREEVYFTSGRIKVRGKLVSRGKGKRADYILYSKPNQPIAVIEAKDNIHSIGSGIQQGLEYAEILDLPFVYSSNGYGFVEHDKTTGKERELALHEFSTPDELWNRLNISKGIDPDQEKIITQDYHYEAGGKTPRYYQRVAINRAVEAIIKGQNRILLVMATGTGKTYVAFQIIWRLWKARAKKRILYLADRNILIDQTVVNDFKPFGDKMTKIKKRQVDKSYEIYMALYQGVSGIEEWKNIYKQFSRDFFDLIIVDECHRGSAAEDSAWREILGYYSSA